jgi:hypothetical protein
MIVRRIHEQLTLPGDELLPEARAEVTHAVDIEAAPEEVFPWLLQMGRRRGGWYSWDFLDNGGVPSADRIIPELQQLAVGDVLPIREAGPEGLAVLLLEPPRALVLGDVSLLGAGEERGSKPSRGTWAFLLEPEGERGTRLLTRVRVEYEPDARTAILRPLITLVHGVMERKQLRTLKRRVEAR